MATIRHGKEAIAEVTKLLDRELTLAERRVVEEEGYVPVPYEDSKGITTAGVGQTGRWITLGFEAAFKHHVWRCRNRIVLFDHLPEYLQAELVQSEYRGDLGGSPKAMYLFNAGKYYMAADEFLDHAEFLDPFTPRGIRIRILRTAAAIVRYADES